MGLLTLLERLTLVDSAKLTVLSAELRTEKKPDAFLITFSLNAKS